MAWFSWERLCKRVAEGVEVVRDVASTRACSSCGKVTHHNVWIHSPCVNIIEPVITLTSWYPELCTTAESRALGEGRIPRVRVVQD